MIKKQNIKKDIKMAEEKKNEKKEHVCSVCNWVYDGDIPFEELPDDFVCHVCGVDKSFFS
jgi:rubredoxin